MAIKERNITSVRSRCMELQASLSVLPLVVTLAFESFKDVGAELVELAGRADISPSDSPSDEEL
jgi:hypothetical protein